MAVSSEEEAGLSELHSAAPKSAQVHSVQFYSQDAFLIQQVSRQIAPALEAGSAAVVIATPDHRALLARALADNISRFSEIVGAGRYVALDACETLSKFMFNGLPDKERFMDVVGDVVRKASQAALDKNRSVIAFGEMVAVLWDEGKKDAVLQLEQLWNDLIERHPLSLLCGYRLQAFSEIRESENFIKICAEHSYVLPDQISDEESIEAKLRDMAYVQQKTAALEKELEWRRVEDRFRQFVGSIQDYAIFMLDPEGYITTWNPGAERVKGYRAPEIIGRHFSNFYPEEDIRSGKPAMALEVASREGRFEDEGWRLRKDGSRFWANVVITAVRDRDGHLLGFGKVTRDSTPWMEAQRALDRANQDLRKEVLERKLAEHKLSESERSLRLLSVHLLRSQDEERRRIGRDLHDSMGQILTAIKMNLESLDPKRAAPDLIERCVRLADNCIKEIRTMSYLLYPPMLEELGLRSAVPWYLEGFGSRSGMRITFDVADEFNRLPREVELAMFRVLQESLSNVHRHSGSAVAHVSLFTEHGNAVLEVRDEGRGLPSELAAALGSGQLISKGVGLRGMDERLRQLRGRLHMSSSSRGTTLRAVVPVQWARAA